MKNKFLIGLIALIAFTFTFSSCKRNKEEEWKHYVMRVDSKGNTVKYYLFGSNKTFGKNRD